MKNFIITLVAAISVFTNSFALAAEAQKINFNGNDFKMMTGVLATHNTVGDLLSYIQKFDLITEKETEATIQYLSQYGVTKASSFANYTVKDNVVSFGKHKITIVDENSFRNAEGKLLKIRQQYETFDKAFARLVEENKLNKQTAANSLFINRAYAKEQEYTIVQNIGAFFGIVGLFLMAGGLAAFGIVSTKSEEIVKCDIGSKILLNAKERADLLDFLKFNKDRIANSFKMLCVKGKSGAQIFAPTMVGDKIDQKVEYSFIDKADKCSKKLAEAGKERKNIVIMFDANQDTEDTQSRIHRYAFDGKATVCNEVNAKIAEQKIKEDLRQNRIKLSSLFAESLKGLTKEQEQVERVSMPAQNGRGAK